MTIVFLRAPPIIFAPRFWRQRGRDETPVPSLPTKAKTEVDRDFETIFETRVCSAVEVLLDTDDSPGRRV